MGVRPIFMVQTVTRSVQLTVSLPQNIVTQWTANAWPDVVQDSTVSIAPVSAAILVCMELAMHRETVLLVV